MHNAQSHVAPIVRSGGDAGSVIHRIEIEGADDRVMRCDQGARYRQKDAAPGAPTDELTAGARCGGNS